MYRRTLFGLALVLLTFVNASTFIGSLITLAPMNLPRAGHTTTLLQDGNVLITGGCIAQGCENQLTESAELYDSINQRFIKTGSMKVARVGHQAILGASGDVYIFGGWAGSEATAIVEKYNPQTNSFEPAGQILEPRDGFTATRLQDGRIFIAGGYNGNMKRLSSTEIYDPLTQTSVESSPMSVPRMAHSASLLNNGHVLIVGGNKSRGQVLDTAELFDPSTQTFTTAKPMSIARHKHAAIVTEDGNVLIIGGSGDGDFDEKYTSIERFDSQTLTFENSAHMQGSRFKIPDAVTRLDNDQVLIAGGHSTLEIYNSKTNHVLKIGHNTGEALFYSTATRLESKGVLITGGYNRNLSVTNQTWLYTP